MEYYSLVPVEVKSFASYTLCVAVYVVRLVSSELNIRIQDVPHKVCQLHYVNLGVILSSKCCIDICRSSAIILLRTL